MAGRGGFARGLCTKSARETTSKAYSNLRMGERKAPQPGLRWTSDKDSRTLRILGVRLAGCARLAVHWACTARSPSLQKVLFNYSKSYFTC